ncbi:MAG: DNA polymerase II large subunit, partial [Promethearchaeota archaeon]
MVEMSKEYREYFDLIQRQVDQCYDIAERAKQKGLDPELYVESPQAKDLAGRVEKLVGPDGVAKVIRELKEKSFSDDQIVFRVVSDILEEKIGKFETLDDRVERAIRVGLAIKTMGVVSAPLEGISKIKIRKDHQGNKYLSLYFAGPIRAAGGTTAALCVLIADFVREKSNLPKYEATEAETGRYVEEVKLYDRRVHLQYPSNPDEIRFAVEHLPVEINGDSTENEEVSAFRNLPRIETNSIRGGACLVLNDGIILKAPKLLKIANTMNLKGWDWLADLKKLAVKEEIPTEDKAKEKESEKNTEEEKIPPNHKYVADIIAGRPVFSHPSRIGGHRIRYGRSRNTGLAAGGFHPATMYILDRFVAIGTQLRTERPGKSTSICPVSSIEPPIIKLENGDVVRVTSASMAHEMFPKTKQILFLGDILFGFGEFSENNHKLIPSGYVEEWWVLELEQALQDQKEVPGEIKQFLKNPFEIKPTAEEALHISETYKIPLHPAFTDFWGNLTVEELKALRDALMDGYDKASDKLNLGFDNHIKKILEKAFVPHRLMDDKIIFSSAMNHIYIHIFNLQENPLDSLEKVKDVFDFFSQISGITIKNKAPYFMGTRMGRPEKSERKSMKGIHTLFPLSDKVGNSRAVEKAIELGKIKIEVCRKKCMNCGKVTLFHQCPQCGSHTEFQKICENCKKLFPMEEENCSQCGRTLKYSSEAIFNFKNHINLKLKETNQYIPKKFKGIFGLTNELKVPEPIEKGILRAKNKVLVYKTAEIRYDATDIPLTHFKPKEIGVSTSQLKNLGYTYDYKGQPISRDDQI